MNEIIDFLEVYENEVLNWVEKPKSSASVDIMKKILQAIRISINVVKNNGKISFEDRNFFQGGSFLAKYFDGWEEDFHDKYFLMVEYIKSYHY